MIEARGDLWTFEPDRKEGRVLRCITTNGAVRPDGAAVMGRGCAAEAKERIPGIEYHLGALLVEHGNRVFRLCSLADGSHLASFPVKRHWKEKADLQLIERSASQLARLAHEAGYKPVIPRPGCGNGSLRWEAVRPVLEQALPGERFTVITF